MTGHGGALQTKDLNILRKDDSRRVALSSGQQLSLALNKNGLKLSLRNLV